MEVNERVTSIGHTGVSHFRLLTEVNTTKKAPMNKSSEASRFKTAIQRTPQDYVVYVAKEHARHFAVPPSDGHIYVVEDPRRRGVLHWTHPDGTYACLEHKRTYPYKAPGLPLTFHEKRVKGKPTKKKGMRFARDFSRGVTVQNESDTPPALSLIDINRVMQISGFKTSFIYERADFPKPVKLGKTPRSPVRWIEAEVYSWCEALISKRNNSPAPSHVN